MAFSLFEGSRAKSRPYLLFSVRHGDGVNEVYQFTDHEFPVTHNGRQ